MPHLEQPPKILRPQVADDYESYDDFRMTGINTGPDVFAIAGIIAMVIMASAALIYYYVYKPQTKYRVMTAQEAYDLTVTEGKKQEMKTLKQQMGEKARAGYFWANIVINNPDNAKALEDEGYTIDFRFDTLYSVSWKKP